MTSQAADGPRQPRVRVGKLEGAKDLKRELARLYRRAARGEIPAQDAGRLAYVMQVLARVIETSDIEARVAALERAQRDRPRRVA